MTCTSNKINDKLKFGCTSSIAANTHDSQPKAKQKWKTPDQLFVCQEKGHHVHKVPAN